MKVELPVCDGVSQQLKAYEALDIPITSSDFWQDENECTTEKFRHVFRSATDEEIPLFDERVSCLREAGKVLYEVGLHFITSEWMRLR